MVAEAGCTHEQHANLGESARWQACALVGYQPSGEGTALELRNCPNCQTTRARELVPTECWHDFTSHVADCGACVNEYETANVRSDDLITALCQAGRELAKRYWVSRGWEDWT